MLKKNFLNVELPIIQAPMAGVQDSALAIAVSSAGGLGSLPCAMLGSDELHAELATISQQTDNPVNINFFCHRVAEHNAEHEKKWRKILQPYYTEYGLQANDVPLAVGVRPFSHDIADVLEVYTPGVISFHFGLPAADLLARVKSWGATILASATTVDEALWLEARGVDGIIAQGLEAGGHRGMFLSEDLTGQVGTFALLPQILQRVKVPVIAAGGIADANGVAAALALGATAVQVGTAYLLCTEATTSEVHRLALKSDAARHTAITNVFSGRPARGIVNRIVREIGPMNDNAPAFPLGVRALSLLRQQAQKEGSGDFSSLWCGQNASGCKAVSAAQLTRELTATL